MSTSGGKVMFESLSQSKDGLYKVMKDSKRGKNIFPRY